MNINFIKGDFFNEQDLKNSVKDKDCVIHAVSTLNPGNSNEAYMHGYQRDFIQTIKLCHILAENKTRLIFYLLVGLCMAINHHKPLMNVYYLVL